jgi:hypothetical protein
MISSSMKKLSLGLAILAGFSSITSVQAADKQVFSTECAALSLAGFIAMALLYSRKPVPDFKSRTRSAKTKFEKIKYWFLDDVLGQVQSSAKAKVDSDGYIVTDSKACPAEGYLGNACGYIKPITRAAKDLAVILIGYSILTNTGNNRSLEGLGLIK